MFPHFYLIDIVTNKITNYNLYYFLRGLVIILEVSIPLGSLSFFLCREPFIIFEVSIPSRLSSLSILCSFISFSRMFSEPVGFLISTLCISPTLLIWYGFTDLPSSSPFSFFNR
eukprot:Lithocolla_globosa_v1_NODE_4340_length_1458_cov_22.525303.p2 type:complete len:114 gc:universal NODE_4340_length_1458_cov_22.525303:796-1137(+)